MNAVLSAINENLLTNFYRLAEEQNVPALADCFAEEGYYWDVELAKRYRGREIAEGLAVYFTAFPNIHRELYDSYVCTGSKEVVVTELSLNGTQHGALVLPWGVIEPTGKHIHVPCCEILKLEKGKILSFHCYIPNNMLLRQLGVHR
jgi:predicted ester cyclase